MRFIAAIALISALTVPSGDADAQEIDTDHLFAFSLGTDIGEVGTIELESEANVRVGKRGNRYTAYSQELEVGYIPVENLHVFVGGSLAYYDIDRVPGLEDRRKLSFNELEAEVRYRLMDRARSPFGLAVEVQPGWAAVEETSGERKDSYGFAFSLLADKEIIEDRVVAVVNIAYELEAARADGSWEKESALRISGSLGVQVRPGLFLGAEVQHLRRYEGLGLDSRAGQATFLGPSLCWKPGNIWVIAGWSTQVAGDAAGFPGSLDLINFERNRAKLTVGFSF
ncbi:hypothetical protein [Sphingopyxis chilensis]